MSHRWVNTRLSTDLLIRLWGDGPVFSESCDRKSYPIKVISNKHSEVIFKNTHSVSLALALMWLTQIISGTFV